MRVRWRGAGRAVSGGSKVRGGAQRGKGRDGRPSFCAVLAVETVSVDLLE